MLIIIFEIVHWGYEIFKLYTAMEQSAYITKNNFSGVQIIVWKANF